MTLYASKGGPLEIVGAAGFQRIANGSPFCQISTSRATSGMVGPHGELITGPSIGDHQKARDMAAPRLCGEIYLGAPPGLRCKKKPADQAVIIRHLEALVIEGLAMKVQKGVKVISDLYLYSEAFCLANVPAVPIAPARQNPFRWRPRINHKGVVQFGLEACPEKSLQVRCGWTQRIIEAVEPLDRQGQLFTHIPHHAELRVFLHRWRKAEDRPQIGRQQVGRVKQDQTAPLSPWEGNSSLKTTLRVAITQNLEFTA